MGWSIFGYDGGGDNAKKLQDNARKQVEEQRSLATNNAIDDMSLSDADIKGIISNLMQNIGTQVSQNQNRVSDSLFDAPEATKLAALRGSEIRGNKAIADAVPKIKLAGKQSKIDATKLALQLEQQQQQFDAQMNQRRKDMEMQMITSLFGDIGEMMGGEVAV